LSTQVESGLPQWERSRDKIEKSAEFSQLQRQYPLQARLLLAFFSFADDAIEALITRGDVQAAQKSASAMGELFTWLKNTSAPRMDKELADLFGTLVRAGVPMERVAGVLQNRFKKGKGAPVSNRLPVLLAVEQKIHNPRLSWMRLAMKFCQCGEEAHNLKCRERLRHQAQELDEMLHRLGV
jgi:hypothetical protein